MSFTPPMAFSQLWHNRDSALSHLRPNSAWYCYRARSRRKAMLAAHQLTEGERLAISDIDFVEHETGMHQYCRILEIGCGWGRHSLELVRRGYRNVISLDVCSDVVAYAQERAAKVGYTLHLYPLDFLDYRTDVPFDVILSLYDRSCLGQPDEMQDCRGGH